MQNTKGLVANFIEEIWNKNQFEKIDSYLHKNFKDLSLPSNLPINKEGTLKWISLTSNSFEHLTIIEDQVTEGNKSIIRIQMQLKHIGLWRGIEPTGLQISTIGYRYFEVEENKIINHRALIDGNSIENQLKNTTVGCKINV